MKKYYVIITILFIFPFSTNAWGNFSMSLDFEDGLLPSSHGWVEFGSPTSTIISDTTNIGLSDVLYVQGSNSFGWMFDLTGHVDPSVDWILSADLKQSYPGACFWIEFNENDIYNRDELIMRDGAYHNIEIRMNHQNNLVTVFGDGDLLETIVPVDQGFDRRFMPSDFYFGIYWANQSQSGSFYADNVSFDAVPIPGAIWLLGTGLIGLTFLRKKVMKMA